MAHLDLSSGRRSDLLGPCRGRAVERATGNTDDVGQPDELSADPVAPRGGQHEAGRLVLRGNTAAQPEACGDACGADDVQLADVVLDVRGKSSTVWGTII
jgi:hypothetical protein